MFAELTARIQALFRRRQLDDDLDQELQSHLDLLTEEHLRRGLSPEEARRAARLQVGGLTSHQRTSSRDPWIPYDRNPLARPEVRRPSHLQGPLDLRRRDHGPRSWHRRQRRRIHDRQYGFPPRPAGHQSARALHSLLAWPGRRTLQRLAHRTGRMARRAFPPSLPLPLTTKTR